MNLQNVQNALWISYPLLFPWDSLGGRWLVMEIFYSASGHRLKHQHLFPLNHSVQRPLTPKTDYLPFIRFCPRNPQSWHFFWWTFNSIRIRDLPTWCSWPWVVTMSIRRIWNQNCQKLAWAFLASNLKHWKDNRWSSKRSQLNIYLFKALAYSFIEWFQICLYCFLTIACYAKL